MSDELGDIMETETGGRLLCPIFSGGSGIPWTVTLYGAHFDRLNAVVAAARSGNPVLIKLALANLDEHGAGAEEAQ